MDVVVLFLRGGLASTAIAPMEVFRSAGVVWNLLDGQRPRPRFRVTTASVDGHAVRSDGPVSLTPERPLSAVRKADLVIVPATGLETDELLARHAAVVPWLQRWYRRGTAVAGICSGVALLAEAGLLDGRRATTHWGMVDSYRQRYPAVDWRPELFVTEHDNVYCGGGVYASLDLSLHLVERLAGREVAVQCAKALLIDTPRVWQSSYATPPRRSGHGDSKVLEAQQWLHQHFRSHVHLDAVARKLGMSPRNFARRFRQATGETPLAYLHKLRIDESKRLLEQEYMTMQEIAGNIGYDDPVFFRQLFKRYAGVSPQGYRTRFGRNAELQQLAQGSSVPNRRA
ncbi:MAG: AraC family transcriptional regulator [Proteobacteria bacterium]|nr:AraC family transcriptional regulator [Pseudomonadota bacterium]